MLFGQRSRFWLWPILFFVFLVASTVLLRFAYGGSFFFIQPVHAALNPEGLIAIAFIALCILQARSKQPIEIRFIEKISYHFVFIGVIVLVTVLAFISSLHDPFIADDHGLLRQAATESLSEVVSRSLLTHPTSGDFFFRPLIYLLSWLDFKWAGYNPLLWHLWNLLVHTANSLLIFVLCRQLRFHSAIACIAALLFAVHGARPEVVCWVAARYDLVAFFFSAVTLIAALRYIDSRAGKWLIVSVTATVLAVLSKESAFCLPLILIPLFLFRDSNWNRGARQVFVGVLAACLVVLLYRTWFLQGIGGYRNGDGTATAAIFHPLLTLKALFFRAPAILFFPINWSAAPGPVLKIALAGLLICLAAAALAARPARRPLFCSLAVILFALLPVRHLLLISPALTGSRVLYLPSLGFTLFWATVLSGFTLTGLRAGLGCVLLVSELVFLRHNVAIWQEVSFLSQQTCREVAAMTADGAPVFVTDLPATFDGIYFLANGFHWCVDWVPNARPPGVVQLKQFSKSDDCKDVRLIWDNAAGKFDPYKGPCSVGHPQN